MVISSNTLNNNNIIQCKNKSSYNKIDEHLLSISYSLHHSNIEVSYSSINSMLYDDFNIETSFLYSQPQDVFLHFIQKKSSCLQNYRMFYNLFLLMKSAVDDIVEDTNQKSIQQTSHSKKLHHSCLYLFLGISLSQYTEKEMKNDDKHNDINSFGDISFFVSGDIQ